MPIASEIAAKLLEIKAIKLNTKTPFTWASGLLSPIYCDNRIILSHPKVRDLVKKRLVEKSAEFDDIDAIAGVAMAGIPHGMMLADALGLPFAYVRNKPKEHGRQNLIEGELHAGQNVLIVEDLISTGGSSLQVVEAVQAAGCNIAGILAIFTYGFESSTTLFEKGQYRLKTLTNYDALIVEAVRNGYVSAAETEVLQAWRKHPERFGNE